MNVTAQGTTSMSYAKLPAKRVFEAAEKALLALGSKGPDESRESAQRSWLGGLIGLCRAVLADPKGVHDIAIAPNDFTWIMEHYDFTDPRIVALHEHPSTARALGRE